MRRRLIAVTGTVALSLALGAWMPGATTNGEGHGHAAAATKNGEKNGEKNAEVVLGKPVNTAETQEQRQWLAQASRSPKFGDINCGLDEVTMNRHESCYQVFIPVQVILRPSGRVIGTGMLGYNNRTKLNYKSKTYEQNVRLGLLRATGVVVSGIFAKVDLECKGTEGGNCTAKSTNGQGPKLLPYPATNTDYTFNVTSDGTTRRYHSPHARITVTHPASPDQASVRPGRPAEVRCDSEKVGSGTGRGCVNWRYTPTYTLDGTDPNLFEVAGHVKWAQNNLKNQWGVKGKGKPLHMLKDEKLQKKNRQKACGNANPPQGMSCDEFPFAATYEGAYFNPDYSTHDVTATQNSYEGGRKSRGKFLKNNRVLDADPFWVHVK